MQKDSPDGPGQRDSRHESYRGLRRDLRPALAAVLRAAEVPRAFRIGFLAIVPLVALRVLAGFVFGFVDRFLVVAFFFGDAAADFALPVVRFLAASIAAPERPPITMQKGTHRPRKFKAPGGSMTSPTPCFEPACLQATPRLR